MSSIPPPEGTPVPPPSPYSPASPGTAPEGRGGLPPAPPPYQAAGARAPSTVLSLLSMIFGIVGVVASCCYGAGFLFTVTAIILGHLGLRRESARGMALAGVITGYAGVGVALIAILVLLGIAFSPLLVLLAS